MDDPTLWSFRGEGAMNMIFAFDGTDDTLKGHVLRLRKRTVADRREATDLETLIREGRNPASLTEHEYKVFVDDIISPLLGSQRTCHGDPVPVTRHFLVALASACAPLRAAHRLNRELDVDSTVGLLLPDLCIPFGDLAPQQQQTVCIEVKPKCGFLPSTLAHTEHPVKLRMCRYCMHQHLKVKLNKVQGLTGYCPLKLFAHDDAAAQHDAILALFEHAQNNLDVFVDGTRIDWSDRDAAWRLEMSELVVAALRADGVLAAILRVQQMDTDNIEGVAQRLLQWHDPTRTPWSTVDVANLRAALAAFLAEPDAQWLCRCDYRAPEWRALAVAATGTTSDGDDDDDDDDDDDEQTDSVASIARLLGRFLLAATAKDCSVMIAAAPAHTVSTCASRSTRSTASSGVRVTTRAGVDWTVSLGVVDLDPKAVFRIPYYFELDRRVVAAYTEAL